MKLKNKITEELMQKFTRGIKLKEGVASVDEIEKVSSNELRVVIHQGWNRQLRRMAKKCNNKIDELERIRMGNIKLGTLRSGKFITYSKN